jgi:diguanylate cyclase
MTSLSPISQLNRSVTPKLLNRNHATDRLAQEVNRAKQDPSYEFSILLIEFDGLSDITDRLGYASGDEVWGRVLGTLLHDLRANDLCCRLGGDEFLLILPGKGQAECALVMDRLYQRWNPKAGSREATVELSIGVASYPVQGSSVHGLLGAADDAMQSSKHENGLMSSVPELRQSA